MTAALSPEMQKALDAVIEADKDFRLHMGPNFSGDPLTDALDDLRKLMGYPLEEPAPVNTVAAFRKALADAKAAVAANAAPQADWRDDPSADERWNAGVDYAQQKLCKVLDVNPVVVNWDAATETVDGDIEAVTANILTLAMGERWRPGKTGSERSHADAFEAVREQLARRYVLRLLKEIDPPYLASKSVVIALMRQGAFVPAGESGFELLDRMAADGLVDLTGMTIELTTDGARVASLVRPA